MSAEPQERGARTVEMFDLWEIRDLLRSALRKREHKGDNGSWGKVGAAIAKLNPLIAALRDAAPPPDHDDFVESRARGFQIVKEQMARRRKRDAAPSGPERIDGTAGSIQERLERVHDYLNSVGQDSLANTVDDAAWALDALEMDVFQLRAPAAERTRMTFVEAKEHAAQTLIRADERRLAQVEREATAERTRESDWAEPSDAAVAHYAELSERRTQGETEPSYGELVDALADMTNQFASQGEDGVLSDMGLSSLELAFSILERLGVAYLLRPDKHWFGIDWDKVAALRSQVAQPSGERRCTACANMPLPCIQSHAGRILETWEPGIYDFGVGTDPGEPGPPGDDGCEFDGIVGPQGHETIGYWHPMPSGEASLAGGPLISEKRGPSPLGTNPTKILPAGKIFELLDRWTPEQRAEVFYGLEHHWCWHCGHPQADTVHAECGAPSGGDTGDRETE